MFCVPKSFRFEIGQLLGSCVCLCIFPLVLGIHSSNEVREGLEKTNKDELGRHNLGKTFFGCEPHKLDEMDKKKCEGLLTEKECLEAVKSMESGKSPGTVGLPAEFYKVFWKGVSPYKFP